MRRSVSVAVFTFLVELMYPGAVASVEPHSPPCLGLGSTQMIGSPAGVIAFDIGGDYAATLDEAGLTVWTFREDGYPVRRGTWVARRGFPGFEVFFPYLEVDPRGWAFVGGWETGFFVIDLRDPDRPEIVYEFVESEIGHGATAHSPKLAGDLLFFRLDNGSIGCFDVKEPVNPRRVDVAVPHTPVAFPYLGPVDNYLLLVPPFRSSLPIEIWEVSDLGSPQLVSETSDSHGFIHGTL